MTATRLTDLYFIRHGETASNVEGLLHGVTDVPLNPRGVVQARLIAERMAGIAHLDRIVASPLQRALNTARAIQEKSGLPLEIHQGLKEMNFGVAEGLPFSIVADEYPTESERFLDPHNMTARYPGGESRGEFFDRVQGAVDEIANTYLGQHVVVVAHGGFISAALAIVLKEHPNNWRERPIVNCSLTHIEMASTGPVAHLVNDVIHLEQLDLSEERP